jgi:hypothetical protein
MGFIAQAAGDIPDPFRMFELNAAEAIYGWKTAPLHTQREMRSRTEGSLKSNIMESLCHPI